MKRKIWKALLLLLAVGHLFGQIQVSGVVQDRQSGERLPYVLVYAPTSASTYTDAFGHFAIRLETPSTLVFDMLGYEPDTLMVSADAANLKIQLQQASYNMDEIVITERRQAIESRYGLSHQSIDIQTIKELPVILGGKDILKAYQLLPGVTAVREGFTGLEVRGGSSDQVSYFLDGARVYNVNHLFGFLSTFDAESIKYSRLEKGGISASRGEGLSANMEIISKDGNKHEHEGVVDLGLINGGARFSGPIIKDKLSYNVAARKTWYDLLVKAVSTQELVIGFHDVLGKVHYQDDKNTLQISAYNSFDILEEYEGREFYKIGWGNTTASARWTRNLRSSSSLVSNIAWSKFRYTAEFQESTALNNFLLEQISGIEDVSMQTEFRKSFRRKGTWSVGLAASYLNHDVGVQSLRLAIDSSGQALDVSKYQSTNLNLFATVRSAADSRFQYEAGLRFTGHLVANQTFFLMEPRMLASYRLTDRLSISSSFMLSSQTIHKVSTTGIGLQSDLWVPTVEGLKPQQAWQYTLGGSVDLENSKLSTEFFGKYFLNRVVLRDDASFASVYTYGPKAATWNQQELWYEQFTSGIGYAYGMELQYEMEFNTQHKMMLAYTLSFAKNKVPFVNEEEWYWSDQDRRHIINLSYKFKINKHLALNAIWSYQTGNRITLPSGTYQVAPEPHFEKSRLNYFLSTYLDVEAINEQRLPATHRLDISLRKTNKRRPENYWEVSLYNAYNRLNPFYVDYRANRVELVGLYPILPSFSYHLKLY